MPAETPLTRLRDVLDPLTGQRGDICFRGSQLLEPSARGRAEREIDASAWWRLPAPYDADAHMPFVPAGLRAYDLHAGLWGGVAHMNVAIPYQLVRDRDLAGHVAGLARTELPAITPIISVNPTHDSLGFASWLRQHGDLIRATMPSVCKLYTPDPHFQANLEAVREAGLTPIVFAYTRSELEELLATATAPLHIRHATSAQMVASVRAVPGATIQTSPHMLLRLAAGRREQLAVLPVPPDDADRTSLLTVLDQVDVIASDHVSPPLGPPTGPGMQTQQHFLPALLTLSQEQGIALADLWPKVTTGPAAVFGVAPRPGFVVVDPAPREEVLRWPRQRDDRAPYLGRELLGRTIAVSAGEQIVLI